MNAALRTGLERVRVAGLPTRHLMDHLRFRVCAAGQETRRAGKRRLLLHVLIPRPSAGRASTLATLACWLLLCSPAGCVFQNPTVRLHDVVVEGMDFEKLSAVLIFQVSNPNPYQLSVWGLEYDLSADGERFAGGALGEPVAALGAKETVYLHAPVALEYRALLPIAKKFPSAEAVPYELNATVTFNYLGTKFPVRLRHAGRVPPLRAPAWHFRDARLVIRDPPLVQLVFDVDNPNALELALGQLRGTLRLGDESLVRVERGGLASVPPGRTARVLIPVSLEDAATARAVADALARRAALRFEGELRLAPPVAVGKMMLGEVAGDE